MPIALELGVYCESLSDMILSARVHLMISKMSVSVWRLEFCFWRDVCDADRFNNFFEFSDLYESV